MIYLDDRPIVGVVSIPYGCCLCGCGHKTHIASRNRKANGWVKGEPVQYIRGHGIRAREPLRLPEPNPSGLCMCGCGQLAPIALRSLGRLRHIKGKPIQYIEGHHKTSPISVRFWAKVLKSSAPNGCWLWTASVDGHGYGQLFAGKGTDGRKKNVKAHRLSWELHFGVIPDGLEVCHHCDIKRCVRPNHFFLGNQSDNLFDAGSKGLMTRDVPKGVDHHLSRFTEEDILTIRKMRSEGASGPVIASMYATRSCVIYSICNRQTWKHIL